MDRYLERRIETVTYELDDLIDFMKARIVELEGLVDGYENQVSDLDTTIKELESVINEYQLKL